MCNFPTQISGVSDQPSVLHWCSSRVNQIVEHFSTNFETARCDQDENRSGQYHYRCDQEHRPGRRSSRFFHWQEESQQDPCHFHGPAHQANLGSVKHLQKEHEQVWKEHLHPALSPQPTASSLRRVPRGPGWNRQKPQTPCSKQEALAWLVAPRRCPSWQNQHELGRSWGRRRSQRSARI